MNAGYEYREELGPDAAGEVLLGYLARRHSHSTEAVWQGRLARGELSLDGRPARGGERLRPGGRLAWRRPPWLEPDVPLAFGVLYRDADLLAVAKPRGLPTLPGGGFLEHTLLHLVRRRFPGATPLHRLGRGTSGLLLFALSAAARSRLAAAWRAGRIEKGYLALVAGAPRRSGFRIEVDIGRVAHPRLGHVFGAVERGKPAVTTVRVLAPRDGGSLVAARILTGRPHQIRIHLAAAGHPLLGDPLYGIGGLPLPDPGLPGDAGYRLHAHSLELEHPTRGGRLRLECAPPAALALDAPAAVSR